MGASYPIIHSGFRCRRPDPDAHQCLLVVGWHGARRARRTYVATLHAKIPTSIQLTGFAIEVDPSPIWNWPHVRFGSKADMCSARAHVCFGPIADMTYLLDHLIGGYEKLIGYCEAESLGGLAIDHQLELRRLLDWRIAGFCTIENLVNVTGGTMRKRQSVWPVTN